MIFVSGMILTAAEPEKSQKSRGRSGPGHNTETGGTGGTGQKHPGKGGQPCFIFFLIYCIFQHASKLMLDVKYIFDLGHR